MVSFLEMLAFAPVEWMLTWIYMSPLRRTDGYVPVKVIIIKVVLAVAVLGGLFAPLNFIAHRELSKNARQFYLLAFLIVEGIPVMLIIFYRDPSRHGKPAPPTRRR